MFQYFQSFQIDELKKKPHRIYTLVDPAISKKSTADFTAIVTVLVDSMNRIYILEMTRKRLDPIETCKAIFAHYEKWKPYYVAIEAISYQQALKFFIEEQKKLASSTIKTMMIVEKKHTTDKVAKIRGLQPKYAILNVFHNSSDPNTTILEEELIRFPKAVHDDLADALSEVINIIVPINKTVDRAVKKHNKNRRASIMY
jgi:predicted phage terminase large subunit-like protein